MSEITVMIGDLQPGDVVIRWGFAGNIVVDRQDKVAEVERPPQVVSAWNTLSKVRAFQEAFQEDFESDGKPLNGRVPIKAISVYVPTAVKGVRTLTVHRLTYDDLDALCELAQQALNAREALATPARGEHG